MAVSTTTTFSGPFLTNGLTTSFPFAFKAMSAGEVGVFVRRADDDEDLLAPALFEVTLSDQGGTVTFRDAPAAGTALFVFSLPAFEQSVEFENGSRWLAGPVNEVNDRHAIRANYLRARLDRAIRAPMGEPLANMPSAPRRAGRFLAFDARGMPIAAKLTEAELHALIAAAQARADAAHAHADGAYAYAKQLYSVIPKGDPGGNVMAIGLFAQAGGMDIPAGTDLVQTTGYGALGTGAGLYVFDPRAGAQPGPIVNLLQSASNLAASPWVGGGGAITADPAGAYTRLTDTGPGYQRWEQTVAWTGQIATARCIVKLDGVPPSTRKAILRVAFNDAALTQYDILIDTEDGNATDGTSYNGNGRTRTPLHFGAIKDEAAGTVELWVTGPAPLIADRAVMRLYPANGPGNSSVDGTAGTLEILNGSAQLYAGVHPTFVPNNDVLTSFVAADGRVFRLSTDQVVRPQHFGVLPSLLDNTAGWQAFLTFTATNKCRVADISCDITVSAPCILGPNVATKTYTGRASIRATGSFNQIMTFRNQRDVQWSAWIDYYGPGGSDFLARTIYFAEVFDNCRGFDRSAGGASYNGFIYSGLSAHLGNNNFAHWGKNTGYYCGSGSTTTSCTLRTPYSFVSHSSPGTSESSINQRTTLTVDTIPEDALLNRTNMIAWINGRPYVLRSVTRVADDPQKPNPRRGGTITVFPWVDTRQVQAGTLDWMFGALASIAGSNGNDTQGVFEAQLCGAAIESASLYGGRFERVSAQHCGYLAKIGNTFTNVHQTTTIGLAYNEVCRANVILMNGVSGDHGRVHLEQHHAFNAEENWTFAVIDNSTDFRPGAVPVFRGSKLTFRQRPCLQEKTDPDAVRSDELYLDPNYGWRNIVEEGVNSRLVTLGALNAFQRRNLGYSGGQFELHGTGRNGAPTGTITIKGEGGALVNGQASVAFGRFDGPATFSFEWDRSNAGWLVRLTGGKVPDPYGYVWEARTLAAGDYHQPNPATIAGVLPGDAITATLSPNPQGARVEAWASGDNAVTWRVSNPTAAPITLSAGVVRLFIRKAS